MENYAIRERIEELRWAKVAEEAYECYRKSVAHWKLLPPWEKLSKTNQREWMKASKQAWGGRFKRRQGEWVVSRILGTDDRVSP